MDIKFTKMHAQGNDFIIVDKLELKLSEDMLVKLSQDICNRHFGLGADGLVLLNASEPEMIIYNSDGSRAEICGSALRCCCRLIADQTKNSETLIKTDSGILKGIIDDKKPDYVTVEMNTPQLIHRSLSVGDFLGDYISVGNPHFIIIMKDISGNPHLEYGKALSESSFFENGANIEFVRILSRQKIEMLVWERGVGATLACGSGATAAVFSGQKRDLLDDVVDVLLPGGEIRISLENSVYYLGGETTLVAKGVFKWRV